jgi:hypothetical protein
MALNECHRRAYYYKQQYLTGQVIAPIYLGQKLLYHSTPNIQMFENYFKDYSLSEVGI